MGHPVHVLSLTRRSLHRLAEHVLAAALHGFSPGDAVAFLLEGHDRVLTTSRLARRNA
jgi:hypothetical protein